jgi:hypothetical protein
MPRDAEEFGAAVVGSAKGGEPASSSAHNGGADGNCFDVGDCGWTVEDT